MPHTSTPEEREIYDEIARLAQALWTKSLEVRALNTDPKMLSIMLFKRLWSNHRGYTLLYRNSLLLESDIVLRAAIESAICIAANFRLRDTFVAMIRQDAAHTLQGQIKIHREAGATDLVRESELQLRMLLSGLPEGTKAAKLEWKYLAEQGRVPMLYAFHRSLSGVSSHVTGLSLLQGVVGADDSGKDAQAELLSLNKKIHLMMMAGTTLQASSLHAGMLDSAEHVHAAHELTGRLNALSLSWPGVGDSAD